MVAPGVIALATLLIASGRPLPRRPVRYLVLWSSMGYTLERYGVNVEIKTYKTKVYGKKYKRYKVIVRDVKITAKLARLARNEIKLRRMLKRHEKIVLDVLYKMDKMFGWRNFLRLIPHARLLRWFGIKPFNFEKYFMWKNRAIVRHIKPNWRAWAYKRRMYAEEGWEDDEWL